MEQLFLRVEGVSIGLGGVLSPPFSRHLQPTAEILGAKCALESPEEHL